MAAGACCLRDVFEFTPGVLAQSRYGSDESQFSIRGSGLRNNFHVRNLLDREYYESKRTPVIALPGSPINIVAEFQIHF
jgi:hypothetical protein